MSEAAAVFDAWRNGDVPHAVLADWCEERGIVFPRVLPSAMSRYRSRGRSRSGSSAGAERWSASLYAYFGVSNSSRQLWFASISGSASEFESRSGSRSTASKPTET